MTTWTGRCGFCDVGFTTPTPRAYCSARCRDLHRWHGGTVPDAHRQNAARRADRAARRASTNPTDTTTEKK